MATEPPRDAGASDNDGEAHSAVDASEEVVTNPPDDCRENERFDELERSTMGFRGRTPVSD